MPTNTNKLQTLIPRIITKARASLAGNDRLTYFTLVPDFITQLEDRFIALDLNSEELQAVVNTSERLNLEKEIDSSIHQSEFIYGANRETIPEYLHRTKETTFDYYQRVFTAWASATIPAIVLQEMEEKSCDFHTVNTLYTQWLNLYNAQQNKSLRFERISEAIDIKECLIGILCALNISPKEVYQILWADE